MTMEKLSGSAEYKLPSQPDGQVPSVALICGPSVMKSIDPMDDIDGNNTQKLFSTARHQPYVVSLQK